VDYQDGFAHLWHDAQRARSAVLGTWLRQILVILTTRDSTAEPQPVTESTLPRLASEAFTTAA
jgi:hypothetical protein